MNKPLRSPLLTIAALGLALTALPAMASDQAQRAPFAGFLGADGRPLIFLGANGLPLNMTADKAQKSPRHNLRTVASAKSRGGSKHVR